MKKTILHRFAAFALAIACLGSLAACFDPNYKWDFPERNNPDFDWSLLGALTGTEELTSPPIEPPEVIEDGLKFALSEDGGHYIVTGAFDGCISLNYSVSKGAKYLGNFNNEHEYLMDMIGSEKVIKIHPKTRRLRQGLIASNPQLESFQMLGQGEYLHVEGDCLIDTSQKKLIAGLPTAVIPSDGSVTSIGDYAFAEMTKLEITQIPDSMTEIGDYAFFGCKWVSSMSFGDDLESIGDYAFSKTLLSELEIPHSVTNIGKYAFSSCDNLTNVQLGQNITRINEGVFSACGKLA